jgi:hypothetical protein
MSIDDVLNFIQLAAPIMAIVAVLLWFNWYVWLERHDDD